MNPEMLTCMQEIASKVLPAALDRIEKLDAVLENRNNEIDRDRDIIEHLEKKARSYLDLQQVCDDQAKQIEELEKALVEERARMGLHAEGLR